MGSVPSVERVPCPGPTGLTDVFQLAWNVLPQVSAWPAPHPASLLTCHFLSKPTLTTLFSLGPWCHLP